jgi:hypothetical protein
VLNRFPVIISKRLRPLHEIVILDSSGDHPATISKLHEISKEEFLRAKKGSGNSFPATALCLVHSVTEAIVDSGLGLPLSKLFSGCATDLNAGGYCARNFNSFPFHALSASSRLSRRGPVAPQFGQEPRKTRLTFRISPFTFLQNGQRKSSSVPILPRACEFRHAKR